MSETIRQPSERPVLNGRYELHRRIARGGMADVFLAKDQLLDRPVAVKVLFPQFASDPTFVARFRREAQAAANLNHPNIVAVYDWGEHEDTYFIVMEYVEGQTLAELVAAQGHIHPDRAAELAADVAAALGFAHRNGTVHRDVKPGNIMINQAGQIKVADFGIARAFGGADDELTQTGSVMGTASYFSPEQAQGKPVDPRSDLYSLGIVIFEMLTGEPPFLGKSPVAIAYKHVQDVAPLASSRNPAVPRELDLLINRLLDKDPAVRYPAAEDLRADLRRYREGQPLQGIPANEQSQQAAQVGATRVQPVQRQPSVNEAPDPTAMNATVADLNQNPDATTAMPGRVVDTGSTRAVIDTSRAVPASAAVRQQEPVEEYYEPPSRTGVFVVMLAVLLVSLIGLIVYISNTISSNTDPDQEFALDTVQVPTVVDFEFTAARNELGDAGFEVADPIFIEEEGLDPNIVSRQEPEGSTLAEAGSIVTLYVGATERKEIVPSVVGLSLEDAEAELSRFSFGSSIEREFSQDVPDGSIISQSPEAGQEANEGLRVEIVVSQGPAQVEVPEMQGRELAVANSLLDNSGFIDYLAANENSGFVAPGLVIRSEPPAGQLAATDETITVYISSGPADVQVPAVLGLAQDAAETALENEQLAVQIGEVSLPAGDERIGKVVEATPPVGSQIKQGQAVTIRIGREGQDTTTTATTTPGSSSETTASTETTAPTATTAEPDATTSTDP